MLKLSYTHGKKKDIGSSTAEKHTTTFQNYHRDANGHINAIIL
jgi:hypothetical protein